MKKILIAEDNENARVMFQDALSNLGYNVIVVENGYEAINIAREELPDLIILDIMMPEMDGIETTKKIRQDPKISHIPILISSAAGNLHSVFSPVSGTGIQDFIEKPYKINLLVEKIKGLIGE